MAGRATTGSREVTRRLRPTGASSGKFECASARRRMTRPRSPTQGDEVERAVPTPATRRTLTALVSSEAGSRRGAPQVSARSFTGPSGTRTQQLGARFRATHAAVDDIAGPSGCAVVDGRSRNRWSHSPPSTKPSGVAERAAPTGRCGSRTVAGGPLRAWRRRGRAAFGQRGDDDAVRKRRLGGNAGRRRHRTPTGFGSCVRFASPTPSTTSEGAPTSVGVRKGARETQESHERVACRQRRVGRSDSPAEQGLEVASPSQDGGERRGGNGAR
jgi:hypothetical protein